MHETLRLLRGLQELDQDLSRVKEELRRLPAELARRRERIDVGRSRLAETDKKIFETNTRIKEIEDMTTTSRQRLRKLEREVGATADQALIVAFQHEMRTLRRDISEAEEEGLALVDEVDGHGKEKDELQSAIGEQEQEFEEYAANIQKEIQEAETRRQDLDDERKRRMTGPVAPEILTQYEKLLGAREGQAMALLDGRVCQGCYVSVPSNVYVRLARGTEIVPCPSCRRILYLPDAD